MKTWRWAVGMLGAAMLVACGGGAKLGGGKSGAAAALFSASTATKGAQGGLSQLNAGVDTSGSITVSCRLGGKATLQGFSQTVNSTGTSGSVTQQFTMVFDQCANTSYDDPKTQAVEKDEVTVNGQMTVSQLLDFNVSQVGSTGNVKQTLKGKITYGGAFNDYLDADVTQTVSWAAVGSTGGNVSTTLDGYIQTSTEKYTYAHETVTFTAGQLVAQEP